MIVWVASYPRSGNRFVRTLLRRSFRFPRVGNLYSAGDERGQAPSLAEINFSESPELLDEARLSDDPIFVKTHALADANDGSPAVYLVRDGRDAITSYARFAIAQKVPGFADRTLEEATQALIGQLDPDMGGWSTNVRSWTRRATPTAIVRFEELIREPIQTLAAATASIGIPLGHPAAPPPSFEELKRDAPVLYSRGKVGAWKSEMTEALERQFWGAHGAEMLAMGYRRERPGVSDAVAP